MPRFDIVCPNDVVNINTSMLLQALGQLHPTTEFSVRTVAENSKTRQVIWSQFRSSWAVTDVNPATMKTFNSKSEAEEWLDANS